MNRAEDILKRLFARYVDSDQSGLVGFFSQWESVVGTDLAAHTDPVDIRNGALYIEVDHPAWLQRLHTRQKEILAQIAHRFPSLEIELLYFRLKKETSRPEALQHPRGLRGSGVKSPGGSVSRQSKATTEPPGKTVSRDGSEALERLPESNLKRSLERLKSHLEEHD